MTNRPKAALRGLLLLAALLAPAVARAEIDLSGRSTLGVGRFFNNDYLGDGKDRWQTGSYNISVVRGVSWDGALPARPFEIMEYRFGASIIAPSVLSHPPAGDRRYAGVLHFAAKTQFEPAPKLEAGLGFGLVAVGPSTGVSHFHESVHRIFSAPTPKAAKDQLGDHLYPVIDGELGRSFSLGGLDARPFVEARAGDETLVRAGIDLAFGMREQGALWLRDEITGQRYVGISGRSEPLVPSLVLGADVAHVFDSSYFPSEDGVDFEGTRTRLRAGVSLRSGTFGLFYGVTWLSKEFEGQPEGQVLGSLRARVNF